MLDPFLVRVIVIAVVVAWLALTLASIFLPGVEVPQQLSGLFLLIAGAAVAKAKGDPKDKETDT